MWGALSDERTDLLFTVILGSESHGTHDILLSQIRDSPTLDGQIGFHFRRLLRLAGLRW
jgi:hypothetical protein